MSNWGWVLIGISLVVVAGFITLEIVEQSIFPVWESNFFSNNPATLGPYDISEKRIINDRKIDGKEYPVSVFVPKGTIGPLPVFIWLMTSNVKAYYQQGLHEALASWGYLVIVPETPPFSFTDLSYHRDILDLSNEALDMALSGKFGPKVDDKKLAAGGYSTGASLAAFLAGERPEIDGLVYWAPSGSPYWLGVNGKKLYSKVNQPALYVLGEYDSLAPPSDGYPDTMQKLMPDSSAEILVIEKGKHHYFQQPTGADELSEPTTITRYEQQREAIDITRGWLNELFEI